MVAVGIVVAFFPSQMALDQWPHLAHVHCVGIILEVPQQLVHIVQVHVVVVHLVITMRVAADISVRVHLCAPPFLCPSHVHLNVLRRMRNRWRNARHLTFRISVEMQAGTLMPPQHITGISRSPASQRHAPANGSMQERLSVPDTIGCGHQRAVQCIDKSIRCLETDSGQLSPMRL